jgi:zinc/manganese transport system substrate-binding protein
MRQFAVLFLAGVLLQTAMANVHARIEVFACEPEWAALIKELGGDNVRASSATTALQDVHHIQARPSLIARLRSADLLICTGAGLEEGWLPVLQRRANNPRVQIGTSGYLEVSNYVRMRDRPDRIDRAEGDIHPRGNPHIQLDPRNIQRIAGIVTERLIMIDPAHAEEYQAHLATFMTRWQHAIERWEAQAKPLRGIPVVVHHNAWVYLEQWLGLEVVGTLEPKPGIPPSSTHLSQLLAQLEQRPAQMVIRSAYQGPRASDWLSQRANIPAVVLPSTVGGSEGAQDLFGLFDVIIRKLLEATS